MTGHVAAIDLGATSGRVVLGTIHDGRITIELVSRFLNTPTLSGNVMRWNVSGLYDAAVNGLGSLISDGATVSSIGVDSWAVDYGLMKDRTLTAEPRHYRDSRTAAGVEAVHAVVGHDKLYARNGLQFLPFNTLYQLAADRLAGALDDVDSLLLIPDLFGFWMTGEAVCEETNASTTGLLPTSELAWDQPLIELLGLSTTLFPPLVRPGDRIGELSATTMTAIGSATPIPVTAVGSHDTASAVVAVPMDPATAVYISCGTWGLVGVELDEPILSDEARAANFTNERGVDGTTRFLRNVMGLWMLSECVRDWERNGQEIDLDTLLAAAATKESPTDLIYVDDPDFMAPGGMNERIAAHLQNRGLPAPTSAAETARLIVDSLAEAFALNARTASQLANITLETIHIVGGGAQNRLLCQLVADRSGVEVIAGPVEATALGNVLIQSRAAGLLAGELDAMRHVVRSSCELNRYRPNGAIG